MSNRYKCHNCKLVLKGTDLVDGIIDVKQGPWTIEKQTKLCPECKGEVMEMCEDDHCHCSHDITETIAYCEKCGHPVCPECHCHDVVQISRVTGYLQEVSGWNVGKQQELKDRTRYDVV